MRKSFKQGTILLVTSQITQRSGLRKTLFDLGVENRLIEVAGDYEQAKTRLAGGVVNILVTDDEIGNNRKGVELMELHYKNNPVSRERIFMIMMSESSPFLLADFSLKGGDIILSKPFTNETFIKTLKDVMTVKEGLSEEECLALDVQDAIRVNDLEKAKELSQKFKNISSTNALYSRALLHEASSELECAFEVYEKVVKIRPDFKSLVNLVRIGTTLNKHFEMLGFIEMWLKHFPLHHNSLLDISRIIIANKRFELLDEIFDLFSKNKINDTFARIPLAAGFVMASAHHLENQDMEKTKKYALKAIEYSCKKIPVISKALEILVKAGHPEEAEKAYLKLTLPMSSVEDKVVDIKLKSIIYPKSRVAVDCSKLLSQKVVDPELYKITISCMKAIGKDPSEIIIQARKAFPGIAFENVE